MSNEFVTVKREVLEQVIEKAEAATKHFNIERIGESTYKDTNTRRELHEAVNKLRAALEQPGVEPAGWLLGGEFYEVQQCRLFSKNPGEVIQGQIPLYTGPQPAQQPEADKLLRQALEALIDCRDNHKIAYINEIVDISKYLGEA